MSDFIMQEGYTSYSASTDSFFHKYDGKTLNSYIGHQSDVIVPAEVKQLGFKCFFDNKDIRQVRLPNGLIDINDKAFMRCENLEVIEIPSSVEWIGVKAFWGCKNLKTVVIYSNKASIGPSCFDWCTSLETMYFASPLVFNKAKEQLCMAADYGILPRNVQIKFL